MQTVMKDFLSVHVKHAMAYVVAGAALLFAIAIIVMGDNIHDVFAENISASSSSLLFTDNHHAVTHVTDNDALYYFY